MNNEELQHYTGFLNLRESTSKYKVHLNNKSENTAYTYWTNLQPFLVWIKKQEITHPQISDLERYISYLKNENYKDSTIKSYQNALGQFFKWMEREGRYLNISKHIDSPSFTKKHTKDALEEDEVIRIVTDLYEKADTLTGKRNFALFLLLVTTGVRTIEVCRADVQDLRTRGGLPILDVQGKGKREADEFVRVPTHVNKAIREYINARKNIREDSPLFASHSNRNQGGRMDTKSVSRIIRNILIQNNVKTPRITAHSMRHTAATLNLLNGGSLRETQKLLRHKSVRTTEIYTHDMEDLDNPSSQRINDALFKKTEIDFDDVNNEEPQMAGLESDPADAEV